MTMNPWNVSNKQRNTDDAFLNYHFRLVVVPALQAD